MRVMMPTAHCALRLTLLWDLYDGRGGRGDAGSRKPLLNSSPYP